MFERLKQTFPSLSITQTSDTSLLLADTALPGFKEFKLIVVERVHAAQFHGHPPGHVYDDL